MIYNAFKDLRKAFESDPEFNQDAWDEACNQFLIELEAQAVKMSEDGSIPPLKQNELVTEEVSS
jgi:hypothetical protein